MSVLEPKRQQTAIQGLASAAVLNLSSKALLFLRQMVIASVFGLSAWLDAFFVATSFVAIFITVFGDIFDSAGIPSLVKVREREGEKGFRALTGSIFTLALIMGFGLTALMLVFSPLARRLVPGFPAESAGYLKENLLCLVPYALVFLPYHAIGSFFRSRRGFREYYVIELIVQAGAFLVLVAFASHPRVVPLSVSAGYVLGFLVFMRLGKGPFLFRGNLRGGEVDVVREAVARMLPVYLILYGLVIVDRYFASFLETGSVSALFYAYALATAVPSILNVENIFVTPLAEESDRGVLLTRILSGATIVSLPIILFLTVFGEGFVKALFERGAFDARSTAVTAEALRYYVLGLPAYFALPVCVRSLQIHRKFRWITVVSALSVFLNATLNYLFAFRFGMGVKGIALAASFSMGTVFGICLLLVSRIRIRVRYREWAGVLPNVAAGMAFATAAAWFLPKMPMAWFDVGVRGLLYVVCYMAFLLFTPGGELRRVRRIVFESFPSLHRRLERYD
jgi:putative peptidoglycan lipid II flippase